jgi:competence protein ComEC
LAGIAFVAGVLWVQQWPVLPEPAAAYWLISALLALICGWKYPRVRWVCAVAFGVLWALSWGSQRLHTVLPERLAGQDFTVTGYIASVPESVERGVRFNFVVEEYAFADTDGTAMSADLPTKLRLGWYEYSGYSDSEGGGHTLTAGERWRLRVRLKPPHGFMNPGGFDYETWLFSRNIRATGYVRTSDDNAKLQPAGFSLTRLRQTLLQRMRALMEDPRYTGLIAALTLGYQSDISRQDWDLLLDTGTGHLISVSGLHIGMIAGLCYGCVFYLHGFVCRRRPGVWPAQRSAAAGALCGAAMYSGLAGFSLPTCRALLMLMVALYAVFFFRRLRPYHALLAALVLVVLLDPFAVNDVSFWLSFLAVAILMYLLDERHAPLDPHRMQHRLRRWSGLQLQLVLALLPLSLFWLGRAALMASVANFIAIPWVGLLVVPLALLATLLSLLWQNAAVVLFDAAAALLNVLWMMLETLRALPYGQWVQHPPQIGALLLAGVGVIWLLSPRGVPARWAGCACLLPVFFCTPAAPPAAGDVWLTVLDVGQGTAAVVRTRSRVLVYDTGPRFSEEFDAGAAVIAPYLRARGIARIDTLVVSHSDDDHDGGLESLLATIPVDTLLMGEPAAALPQAHACRRGQRWVWDEVEFELLHPSSEHGFDGNNASCVLQITAPGGRLLLTGDIEKQAERQLLENHLLQPADILLIPHHGSRTSSTPAFVEAIRPRYAVATTGYRNRFGFPKADIAARYLRHGGRVLNTMETGAIHFVVDRHGIHPPELYRPSHSRYWHHRLHPYE